MKNVSHAVEPPRNKQIFGVLIKDRTLVASQLLINTHNSYYNCGWGGQGMRIITTVIKMNPK